MQVARPEAIRQLSGMKRCLVALGLLVGGLLVSCSTPPAPAPGPVILISLDGFRWDYLQRYSAPTLQRLAREGVQARTMTPSFPTKTFPNHYTLVTGLRPARHGIVGNWFYDPANGETFGMSKQASNTDAKWWGGEPVWITAERQGVRSVCYLWPGSEAAHHGLRPSHWLPFNDKIPSNDRVDGLLKWFDVPAAERPRLATLYFSAVDHGGHKYGPDAPEVQISITEVDTAIARLLDGLVLDFDLPGLNGAELYTWWICARSRSRPPAPTPACVPNQAPAPPRNWLPSFAPRLRRSCRFTCAMRCRRASTSRATIASRPSCSWPTTSGPSNNAPAGR